MLNEISLEHLSETDRANVQKVYDALCAPEDRVWNKICRGLVMKTDQDKYPDAIFWFKQDRCYFRYDIKTGFLWCDHDLVWEVFEKELNWGYLQIVSFIKNKVEEHFKNKGVTLLKRSLERQMLVEEHFKNKGVTLEITVPCYLAEVEEHFKNK